LKICRLRAKRAKVNEEKNAARERAIQIKTRGAKNAYKLAQTLKKARQLDEDALIEIERHRLNDVRRPFKPRGGSGANLGVDLFFYTLHLVLLTQSYFDGVKVRRRLATV
jgi:hypothetical protein